MLGSNKYKSNATYNLWTLNPKRSDGGGGVSVGPPGKKSGPLSDPLPLTVMTRSKIHGVERVGRKGEWCIRCTVACKPEHQPDFGCEVTTKSDIAGTYESGIEIIPSRAPRPLHCPPDAFARGCLFTF